MNDKWEISFCDTHAEVVIYRKANRESTYIEEVKIESTTGAADVRMIGVTVQAILNGESDLLKLATENRELKRRLNRVQQVAKGDV